MTADGIVEVVDISGNSYFCIVPYPEYVLQISSDFNV